jgi:hypothetical protein
MGREFIVCNDCREVIVKDSSANRAPIYTEGKDAFKRKEIPVNDLISFRRRHRGHRTMEAKEFQR